MKVLQNHGLILRRAGEGCSLLATVLSAALVWSWVAGVADLYALPPLRTLSTPSSAFLLLCCSLVMLVADRWSRSSRTGHFGAVVVGLVGLCGLGVLVRWRFGWSSPFEEWLARVADSTDSGRSLQMCSLSGACFLALALGLLAGRWQGVRRGWISWFAIVLVSGVLFVSVAAGRSYLAGSHSVFGRFQTPAFSTSVGFLLLSLAFLARTLTTQDRVGPDRVAGAGSAEHRLEVFETPLFVSLLSAFAISLVTAAYLRHAQSEERTDARELLEAIGRLKASQVANWRDERLGDARFFARAAFVARDAQHFLANPESQSARDELLQWLRLLKAGDRYGRVDLYDTNLVWRLGVSPSNVPDPALSSWLRQVLLKNALVMGDLERGAEPADLHLDIGFPILEPTVGPAANSVAGPGTPIGVVLLRLDPRQFLFPMIEKWPTPSRSAETLLVRREGDDVVFLNNPRAYPGTEGPLRQPIRFDGPSAEALAVLGQTGALADRDYHGVPVLASVETIKPAVENLGQTPWILVAKIDCDEVYGPLRRQAALILAVTLLLVIAAGLLTWVARHRREAALARIELAAGRERLALARRFEHLLRNANDAIIFVDQQNRILEANDRTLSTYGYSLTELQSLRLPDLRAPQTRDTFAAEWAQLIATGRLFFETLHQRKDGSIFPVEVSCSLIRLDGVPYTLSILRDITKRTRAEEALRDSLREKEALLKEVHHRVKNNLQLISSLLRLQEAQIENPITRAVLQDTQTRVRSIALLHEALYRSHDLAQIELAQYVTSLVSYLQRALPQAARIPIHLQIAPVSLTLDQAVPCGLIINELITNSLKHAFPPGVDGEIHVSLQLHDENRLELRVSDNGVGLPDTLSLDHVSSLGLQIVLDLAQQLEGRLEIHRAPSTTFTLHFPKESPS